MLRSIKPKKESETESTGKKRTLRGVGALSRSLAAFAFRLFRQTSQRTFKKTLLEWRDIPDVDLITDTCGQKRPGSKSQSLLTLALVSKDEAKHRP